MFFAVCSISYCGIVSGEKKLITKDVSGLKKVKFPLKLSKSLLLQSKTISINLNGVDVPCKMYVENKGELEHRITWTKEIEGKRLGGNHQLKPLEKKEIYDGSAQGLGFIIYDLKRKKTNITVTIIFSDPLPKNTKLSVRAFWGDSI